MWSSEILQGAKYEGTKQLLRKLVDYWDPVDEAFVLDEDVLHVEVDDIYFITGLSRRGLEVSLIGVGLESLTVCEYNQEYCTAEAKVKSTGVQIKYIRNLSLKDIVYTINRMAGSVVGHLATRQYGSSPDLLGAETL